MISKRNGPKSGKKTPSCTYPSKNYLVNILKATVLFGIDHIRIPGIRQELAFN